MGTWWGRRRCSRCISTDVVDAAGGVHGVDPENRVKTTIEAAKEDTEVFPMLNDYNTLSGAWNGDVIGKMLENPAARNRLHVQLDKFLFANPNYRGICLDFEMVPDEDEKLYAEWIGELHNDFHAKNLRIYVNAQAGADDATLRLLGQNSDGIILMNYDEHEETSDPGPVASEPWFEANLTRVLKLVPKEKIICGIGNYGFDWAVPSAGKREEAGAAGGGCRRPLGAGCVAKGGGRGRGCASGRRRAESALRL